jgi:hypothetical protein
MFWGFNLRFLGSIVSTQQRSSVKPALIFFTSNGRIGIISEVKSDFALLLTALERNLGDLPLGPVPVPVPLDPGKEPNSKSRHAMCVRFLMIPHFPPVLFDGHSASLTAIALGGDRSKALGQGLQGREKPSGSSMGISWRDSSI